MSSNYIRNQNSVQRWDNILRNLRRDVAILKRLTLRKCRGNLVASSTGLVRDGPSNSSFGPLYIGKIVVDDSITIDPEESELFETEDFVVSLEKPDLNTLLIDEHLFTVPYEVDGISLIGKNVYVKISVNFLIQTIEDRDENPVFSMVVKKNSLGDTTDHGIMVYGTDDLAGDEYILAKWTNFNLIDVIKCTSGDTIDIEYHTSEYIKALLESGNHSYVVFEIIGYD